MLFQGHCLINGAASAELLYTESALSFWGGVDPQTGRVLDHHHPLCGQCLSGRILAIPCGRGSCSGSALILELLLNSCAPAGLIFEQPEEILTLGVLVGKVLFERSMPVMVLSPADFRRLRTQRFAAIGGDTVHVSEALAPILPVPGDVVAVADLIQLSQSDKSILEGSKGEAAREALEIIIRFAAIQGAKHLLDVSRAHIDACVYTGPAVLRFAQKFEALGGEFVIPTTLNSISIDKRRWREIGMDEELAAGAGALANAYVSMGAQPTFTCAPYTLESAPELGEDIGWAESNAVLFANSVLGARTQKYPDFIDVCIALTGRAPSAGSHLPEGRQPTVCIQIDTSSPADDSIFPLLGYLVGKHVQHRIPLICGLDHLKPSMTDLKAFSASFATTSAAAMFHMERVTPEAAQFAHLKTSLPQIFLGPQDIDECWHSLNSAHDPSVGLVSLGNPHFSIEELAHLVTLCSGRNKSPSVEFVITMSRNTQEKAAAAGFIETVEAFGATIITDTCWCMLGEPVIPKTTRNIMTNSGKYAHYAPGLVKRGVHFGSLAQCVDAACEGTFMRERQSSIHSMSEDR